MAKYRKKPVVVEAYRWMRGETSPEPEWLVKAVHEDVVRLDRKQRPPVLRIKTLEGVMTAHYGDYIIRGIRGELYPCKPDIFEATYDLAEE